MVWQSGDPEGRLTQVEPASTFDPTTLAIPASGSRDELLYYADLLGFGKDGRPSIDEYFNPYYTQNPVTKAISSEPTLGLVEAAEEFYGSDEDLAAIAASDRNNPLIYWEDDPITTLNGEARIDMSLYMATSYNKPNMALFLDQIGADRSQYWNYEPAWLLKKMHQEPMALRVAQFQLLQSYAENPEAWEWLQTTEPIGPTD